MNGLSTVQPIHEVIFIKQSPVFKRSPFYCPVIEYFIWTEPLLRGHLSYKTTFSLTQRWPLNTGLTAFYRSACTRTGKWAVVCRYVKGSDSTSVSMFFILDFGTVYFVFHVNRQTFHTTCTFNLCLFSMNIMLTCYYIWMERERERERERWNPFH